MEDSPLPKTQQDRDKTWTRGALWQLTGGWRIRYASAIGALALSILFLYGVPLLSQILIDGIMHGTWPSRMTRLSSGFTSQHANLLLGTLCTILLTAIAGGFQYLRNRWSAQASEGIIQRLRDRLYGHIARLPQNYHDKADSGDLVQRCTSDVETVRVFLGTQVVEIARAVLMLVLVLPVLFWMKASLAIWAVALFPLIMIFAFVFFRRVQARFLEMDEAEGRLTSVLQENLNGIRVVRAFARQEHEKERFGARNQDMRERNMRLLDLLGVYWSASDLLCMAQLGIVLFVGINFLSAGEITVGTLFAFLSYHGMVIFPVRQLGRTLTDTGKAIVALGRLEEILAVEEETHMDEVHAEADSESIEASEGPRGTLAIEGLTFEYADGTRALHDLSVTIEAGETIALLGPPGAGKTTLVNLFARLYDYSDGSIRIDGVELNEIPRRSMRRRLGVVSQEPFLYSKTISANLRVGRSDAVLAELESHAHAACVHTDVAAFSSGYETKVGERGVTLSGGQRQRLSLARALLRDPDVLILDDALSAVDTITESKVLDVLRSRKGRSTTLMITSRLSSLAAADRVFVLEAGELIQVGTHRELVEVEGAYRRLWDIQGALESELQSDLQVTDASQSRQAAREPGRPAEKAPPNKPSNTESRS
ncbi:MAG: ATP-binding cassette subfamily B protein [Planctomycetota bacterium]|jgi:ATP-binding cassette subfamily B protein